MAPTPLSQGFRANVEERGEQKIRDVRRRRKTRGTNMAVGQNQSYHFGVGAQPILVYFSGEGDVHCGYGILTHGHMFDWWRDLLTIFLEVDAVDG